MAGKSRSERRADVLRRERRREALGKLKWIGVAAVVVAAIAGGVYALSLVPEKPQDVHWHPTWEVFVNDQNVRWAGPRFDMSNMGAEIHLHQPNDDVIHAEGRSDRVLLDRLLVRLGGQLTADKLVIPAPASGAGTYEANATHPLRVFAQPPDEEWREIEDFTGLQLQDRWKILITYGDLTPDQIARQQASVKDPGPDPAAAMRPPSN